MGGRFSRQKGKRGERALATELRDVFPELAEDIRRGWQTREGDDDPDVLFPGYWFESKNVKRANPKAALEQAIRDSKGRGVPVAVIRETRKKPFAILMWSDLLKLIRSNYDYQRERQGRDSAVRGGSVEKRLDVCKGGRRTVLYGSPKARWVLRVC